MWTIARVSESGYELRNSEGSVVKEYQKTKMRHPNDWISDAIDNGAQGWQIQSGDWQFVDERE